MKKIILFVALFVWVSISGLQAGVATWSDNVACILYTNCVKCHNPNGIATSSFLTYDEARTYADQIKSKTQSGIMPPWPADRSYRSFAHERYLTPAELEILANWADNGAVKGDSTHAPTAPVISTSEEITAPDLVLRIPSFTVSSTNDLYRCFVVDPGVSSPNTFITAFEAIPGNRSIVHHVLIFQDTTGIPDTRDAADPGPGYTNFGGIGSTKAILIGAWVPGQGAYFLPTGMGERILPGAKIVYQIHYPAGTFGMTDSTKVNFKLSTSAGTRNVSIAPPLNHSVNLTDGPLFIPAGTVRTFHSSYHIPAVNLTVLSVSPHMHLIGKSMKAFAVTPANDTINLISIPQWDFHWQGSYLFRQPQVIPANSWLYGVVTYDNTDTNENNPSSPPVDVRVGEATTDEMFLVYFAYALNVTGDQNIVIDTLTSKPTFNDCEFIMPLVLQDIGSDAQISVFPNPANEMVDFVIPNSMIGAEAVFFDAVGRKVASMDLPEEKNSLNVSKLEPGIYFYRAILEDKQLSGKLLIHH